MFVKFVVNQVVIFDVHSVGPSEVGSEEDEPVGWQRGRGGEERRGLEKLGWHQLLRVLME